MLNEHTFCPKAGSINKVDPVIALVAGTILFFVSTALAKTDIAVYLIVIATMGLVKKG